VAIGILAGFGAAWVEQRVRTRAVRLIFVGVLVGLVTVEAWSGPTRTVPFRQVPPVYSLVARLPEPVLLAELPFYPPDAEFENAEYVLNATSHWKPLANGHSGAVPASYRRRAASFWFFPRDWAIDQMHREGITHVMVHVERFTRTEVADIESVLARRPDLRFLGSDGEHRLYRLERH
jgi:hypothetical protein